MTTNKVSVKVRWAGAVAAGLFAGILPAIPAHAGLDQGGNSASCDVGEICFSEFSSDWARSHKDFWWHADHGNTVGQGKNDHVAYTFNAGTNPTRHGLMDAASGIWNRDTSCSVKLWDVHSDGTWFVLATYTQQANWVALNANGNRNNGHSRCSEGSPQGW